MAFRKHLVKDTETHLGMPGASFLTRQKRVPHTAPFFEMNRISTCAYSILQMTEDRRSPPSRFHSRSHHQGVRDRENLKDRVYHHYERRSRSRSRSPHRHYKNNRDGYDHNYHRDKGYRDEPRDRRGHHELIRNGQIEYNPRSSIPQYELVKAPPDLKLGLLQDDPRGNDPTKRLTLKASHRGNGRNTESFDPASTLVRPDMRVLIGSNSTEKYSRVLKHDDVVIVPELFGREDDWTLYYQFIEEIRELQKDLHKNKDAQWISWHEGAHLISKNPENSPTFQKVIRRLCDYFDIEPSSIGTRFNWYRDSADWKPFHHDSAAFNPHRARNQNITVGVSFGSLRELAFIRAREYSLDDSNLHDNHHGPGTGDKCRIYFPQMNNGVFSFGRDVNILWKHGINALPPAEQDGKGRISIILWGKARNVVEEEGSPRMLGSDGQGPHAHTPRDRHHGDERRGDKVEMSRTHNR